MVSVWTVPAREGSSWEHSSGYKTINRIPLPFNQAADASSPPVLHDPNPSAPFACLASQDKDALSQHSAEMHALGHRTRDMDIDVMWDELAPTRPRQQLANQPGSVLDMVSIPDLDDLQGDVLVRRTT